MGPGSAAPTVAIVDAYDDPNAASDLSAFRSAMSGATDPNTGLANPAMPPLCASGTTTNCVNFTKVNQTGGTSMPAGNSGWSEEISLDLDTVSAVCPDCNIVLVEATSSSMANLAQAESEAKTFNPAAVTNSYGGSESSSETGDDSTYSAGASTAITVSAGDSGYGVEYPAASPKVTAVGGTSLSYSGSGSGIAWQAQTVWADSGSGCSSVEAMPSWQALQGVYSNSGTCAHRQVADISADADPNTGVAVYDTYGDSGWMVFGGTSLSAQIIGATYAVASTTGALKASPQALYTDVNGGGGATPGLVPVRSGSNGSSKAGCTSTYLCNAADSLPSGYNGAGGLGTPYGTTALAGTSTTAPSLSFSPTAETLTAGTPSGGIAVQASGGSASGLSVALATTSATGDFSLSSGTGATFTHTLTVAPGQTFYYEDATTGGATVTASATGWAGASLPVTVNPVSTTPTMNVSVSAGALSSSRGTYSVPLTVAAKNASSGAVLGGASATLRLYEGSSCSGTVAASGSGTLGSNGQETFTFQTRTAATWCAQATVTDTGYSTGTGQGTLKT